MLKLIGLAQQYPLVFALFLDFIIGDPLWLPHPVKLIGWWTKWLEKQLRLLVASRLKIAGVILNVLTVTPVFAITFFAIRYTTAISPILGAMVEIFLISTTISIKSLGIAGKKVIRPLSANQLVEAKTALQEIVSRDTSNLDKNQIIRGVVETTAENISDGIIAPLFFAAIGGAPLAMAYKAINTLDSMVGYKNKRYKDFGWFSARVDDIANFIPARITGALIVITATLTLKHPLISVKAIWRDSQNGPSPNGGIPICGIAGALDIQLGGPCTNPDGTIINIPAVGGKRTKLDISDLSEVYGFATITPLLFVLILFFVKGLLNNL